MEMKVLTFIYVTILFSSLSSYPISVNQRAKGILDGVTGTSTASPNLPGLGGLSGLGENFGSAGPLLIIGGFQALVTKFDPALVQGMPVISGVSPIGK